MLPAPNPRMQRTPSAPLMRQPFGDKKRQLAPAGFLVAFCALVGCALGLPPYNEPFDEKVRVITSSPTEFTIHVLGGEIQPVKVPADGRAIVHIPVLPRECSTYLLGVKIKDRSVEAREVVQLIRAGRVVETVSVNHLRRLPVDAKGFHELNLK
jgi:hypothetical protein